MKQERPFVSGIALEYIIYIVLLLACIVVLIYVMTPRQPTVLIEMPRITLPEVPLQSDPSLPTN